MEFNRHTDKVIVVHSFIDVLGMHTYWLIRNGEGRERSYSINYRSEYNYFAGVGEENPGRNIKRIDEFTESFLTIRATIDRFNYLMDDANESFQLIPDVYVQMESGFKRTDAWKGE